MWIMLSLFLALICLHQLASGFPVGQPRFLPAQNAKRRAVILPLAADPLDELSEERKANLFQFMLRDLEVEGVPLLGCDATDPTTFLAALFTTMAEMSSNNQEDRLCLVLQDIPVDALRVLVDDFVVLKTQSRLMEALPELQRFSLSLIGKGVGPAVLIETEERTQDEIMEYNAWRQMTPSPDEMKWTATMKTFVSRMIIGQEVCPFAKDNSSVPSGLEDSGVAPAPIAYRPVGAFDVCDILSAFWYCICELLSLSDEQLSSTVLVFPPVAEGQDPIQVHNRFAVISELISRTLFLYRGVDLFELLHMHPLYDRDLVYPKEKPAHGHLPPTSWLPAMLHKMGYTEEAVRFAPHDLALQNYQRRSPLPAIVIKRVSQLDAAAQPENGITQLDLGDGRIEMASGLGTYSTNTIRMVELGRETLQSSLDKEVALTK